MVKRVHIGNVIKIDKKVIKLQDLVNLKLIEAWPINDQFEDQIEMSSTKVNSVIAIVYKSFISR